MKTLNEKYKVKGDRVIWIIYILFILISLMEVFSSMGKTVYEKQGGAIATMFFKHFLILLLGIVVCYISHLVKYVNYSRIAKPALAISFVLLIVTLLLGYLGAGPKAANRWIVLPFIGQFQPSEIVKYVIIVYTANALTVYKDTIKTRQTFVSVFLPVVCICALIFPENFSTAGLIFIVCFTLMLVGRINRRYHFLSLAAIVLFLALFLFIGSKFDIGIMRTQTWTNRIENFRNSDPTEINQANIALMAISTGGLTGKFIGNTEQARFLSESHNDFIFAIMLEEGGLWFCLLIVLLYIILLYRILNIAKNARGDFGTLVALGIALIFTLQTIVNMAVAVNLIPVTGQPLPFISYGGTSFLFSSFALGIVLNISRKENQKTRQEVLMEQAEQEEQDQEDLQDQDYRQEEDNDRNEEESSDEQTQENNTEQ